MHGSVRNIEVSPHGKNIVTLLRSKDKRNREYKGYLNEETILCLLDEIPDIERTELCFAKL